MHKLLPVPGEPHTYMKPPLQFVVRACVGVEALVYEQHTWNIERELVSTAAYLYTNCNAYI